MEGKDKRNVSTCTVYPSREGKILHAVVRNISSARIMSMPITHPNAAAVPIIRSRAFRYAQDSLGRVVDELSAGLERSGAVQMLVSCCDLYEQ